LPKRGEIMVRTLKIENIFVWRTSFNTTEQIRRKSIVTEKNILVAKNFLSEIRMSFIIALFIIFCSSISALPVQFSEEYLNFGSVEIDYPHSISVQIENLSVNPQLITIKRFISAISFSDSIFTIQPEQIFNLELIFQGKTNILYQSVLVINNATQELPYYLPFEASCYLPNHEFSTTDNLYDTELKMALNNLVINHTPLDYLSARLKMYSIIDNHNNYVECVYTGYQYYHPYNSPSVPDANVLNTEHTWPQSYFSGETPKTDLHHLYPTSNSSNNARGNYPFGEVVSGVTWENGGSKRGRNASNEIVFEPRNEHKGSVARAMLYFAIRYNNPQGFINNQELILKNWNQKYAVSSKESERHEAIYLIQQKKNPFIVHPLFAERIYSFSLNQNSPLQAELIYPDMIKSLTIGETSIPLYNNGSKPIIINSVSTNHPSIEVAEYPSILVSKTLEKITIHLFQNTNANNYLLILNTSEGEFRINLLQEAVEEIEIVKIPEQLTVQLYPNPVYKQVVMKATFIPQKIDFFNTKGQKVFTQKGKDKIQEIMMPDCLAAGIYYLRIENNRQVIWKKLVHIKS